MTEEELARLNALMGAGMARHLACAVIDSEVDESSAWAEQSINTRGYELLGQPTEAWPNPALAWDLSPANWRRAMDGMAAADFAAAYPDVRLYEVDRAELEGALAPAARRVEDPFSESYRSKTSRLVAHLGAGLQVTPPFVAHTSAGWAFAGGYHRFGWACHLGLAALPILARAGEQARLAAVVPSLREITP